MKSPIALFLLLPVAFTPLERAGAQHAMSWSAVESALGRKGAEQPGGVMKFGFPRRDLRVTVNGVALRPAFALGSWVAFKRMDDGQAMVMGDLVLLDREVNPVVRALQEGGVEQTAIHNHLLGATPTTMYVHVAARGDAAKIASAIRAALAKSATPLDTTPGGPAPALNLDTAAIAQALGHSGKPSGGVFQVAVPRPDTIREAGMIVPPSMGVATAINFQATGPARAAVTGDFVLAGDEVNRVIRVLAQNGVGVTALHSHLIGESPRLYFMHFWANDSAVKLARGLGAALKEVHPGRVATVPLDIRWSRASAEHRAAFLQTYALAAQRLEQLVLAKARGSWAVILDADETVLDNSVYQQERALIDSGFTSSSWDAWVRRIAAPALPGAAAFIARVHALGGRVVIVTNRNESVCPQTRENLTRDSIEVDVVLCQDGPSDKNPRFRLVQEGSARPGMPPLDVVMWVGDNIQDFPGLKQDIRLAPDSALAEFGRSWFLLPNPMYGSWERNPLP